MVSFIVIEYHSLEEIKEFIGSLSLAISGLDSEIIISSNSLYFKEKQTVLLSEYPDIVWTFNERNGGFAYGMNEGLKVAKGDILTVVNPDVKILSSLTPMISHLETHPSIGIIGPKIVDKEGVIQDSFRRFVTPWRFFKRQIGRIKDKGVLHERVFKGPVCVDWVIGAFMMCRREVYEKVGGLSGDYFMYCEDMDWCMRAQKSGYDIVYYPEVIIEYKGTRAARRSLKYALIHTKSLLTYWHKYGFSSKV